MLITTTLADGVNYIPLPFDSMIEKLQVVPIGAPGVAGSVTLENGADTVMTVDAASAADGVPLVAVRDATNGRSIFGEQKPLKLTCSSTAAVSFGCTIDLDIHLTVPESVSK